MTLCRCLFLLWPHHAPRQSSHDNLIRPRCKSASSGVRPAGASLPLLSLPAHRAHGAPPLMAHANPTTAPSPSSHSTHTPRYYCACVRRLQRQAAAAAAPRVASLSSRDGRRRRAILHPVHARATALPGRPALRGRGGVGLAH